jgi:hypothetical protein
VKIRTSNLLWSALLCALFLSALFISACGGGNNTPMNSNGSSAAMTVNIGDAPLNNGVLAFEITVNSLTLTGTPGTVNVINSPVTVELSHLAGTFIPLALAKLSPGTYTQLTADLGAAEIVFLPQGASTPVHKTIPALGKITIALTPGIVVPAGATSLNVDVDLASSITIDASNNIVFNPKFTVTSTSIPGVGEKEDDEHGELDDLKGVVGTVSTSSFVLNVGMTSNAHPLTFTVDQNTTFDGISGGLAGLKTGMVVEVNGVTQSSGDFLARRVELESEHTIGMEAEGRVFSTAGMPNSFQLIVHNLGTTITVNLSPNTTFRVNSEFSLNIPSGLTFSASTLAAGQNVEADADSGTGTTAAASRVQLKQQAVDGTVTALSGGTFQLTLDPNSALARLSGQSSINVSAANAENKTGASLANGQVVRVRGLLFFTPANGSTAASYTLVARVIKKP